MKELLKQAADVAIENLPETACFRTDKEKEYAVLISALAEEVKSLKNANSGLTKVADYWEKCANEIDERSERRARRIDAIKVILKEEV